MAKRNRQYNSNKPGQQQKSDKQPVQKSTQLSQNESQKQMHKDSNKQLEENIQQSSQKEQSQDKQDKLLSTQQNKSQKITQHTQTKKNKSYPRKNSKQKSNKKPQLKHNNDNNTINKDTQKQEEHDLQSNQSSNQSNSTINTISSKRYKDEIDNTKQTLPVTESSEPNESHVVQQLEEQTQTQNSEQRVLEQEPDNNPNHKELEHQQHQSINKDNGNTETVMSGNEHEELNVTEDNEHEELNEDNIVQVKIDNIHEKSEILTDRNTELENQLKSAIVSKESKELDTILGEISDIEQVYDISNDMPDDISDIDASTVEQPTTDDDTSEHQPVVEQSTTDVNITDSQLSTESNVTIQDTQDIKQETAEVESVLDNDNSKDESKSLEQCSGQDNTDNIQEQNQNIRDIEVTDNSDNTTTEKSDEVSEQDELIEPHKHVGVNEVLSSVNVDNDVKDIPIMNGETIKTNSSNKPNSKEKKKFGMIVFVVVAILIGVVFALIKMNELQIKKDYMASNINNFPEVTELQGIEIRDIGGNIYIDASIPNGIFNKDYTASQFPDIFLREGNKEFIQLTSCNDLYGRVFYARMLNYDEILRDTYIPQTQSGDDEQSSQTKNQLPEYKVFMQPLRKDTFAQDELDRFKRYGKVIPLPVMIYYSDASVKLSDSTREYWEVLGTLANSSNAIEDMELKDAISDVVDIVIQADNEQQLQSDGLFINAVKKVTDIYIDKLRELRCLEYLPEQTEQLLSDSMDLSKANNEIEEEKVLHELWLASQTNYYDYNTLEVPGTLVELKTAMQYIQSLGGYKLNASDIPSIPEMKNFELSFQLFDYSINKNQNIQNYWNKFVAESNGIQTTMPEKFNVNNVVEKADEKDYYTLQFPASTRLSEIKSIINQDNVKCVELTKMNELFNTDIKSDEIENILRTEDGIEYVSLDDCFTLWEKIFYIKQEEDKDILYSQEIPKPFDMSELDEFGKQIKGTPLPLVLFYIGLDCQLPQSDSEDYLKLVKVICENAYVDEYENLMNSLINITYTTVYNQTYNYRTDGVSFEDDYRTQLTNYYIIYLDALRDSNIIDYLPIEVQDMLNNKNVKINNNSKIDSSLEKMYQLTLDTKTVQKGAAMNELYNVEVPDILKDFHSSLQFSLEQSFIGSNYPSTVYPWVVDSKLSMIALGMYYKTVHDIPDFENIWASKLQSSQSPDNTVPYIEEDIEQE